METENLSSDVLKGAWGTGIKEPSKATLEKVKGLCENLKKDYKEHARLKKEAADIWSTIQKAEREIIAHLEESGLKAFEGEDWRVSWSESKSFKIPSSVEDMDAFFDYLASRNVDREYRTIHHGKLNSFLKEEVEIVRAETGQEDWLPPGIKEPTVSKMLNKRGIK
jgi:hypothetical protein